MSWLSENITGNDMGKKDIEKQKHVGKCKMNHMNGFICFHGNRRCETYISEK